MKTFRSIACKLQVRRCGAKREYLRESYFVSAARRRGAGHERKYLNDALIYLQARGIGASVLTGNVDNFAFLNQLAPGVPIILYRHA
ncbi:hypothetical protein V1280_004436 [Bradyrhizobium sp. AZCC 2230]